MPEWHTSGHEGSVGVCRSAGPEPGVPEAARPRFKKFCCCCGLFLTGFWGQNRNCDVTVTRLGHAVALVFKVLWAPSPSRLSVSPPLAWNTPAPRVATTAGRTVKHFEDERCVAVPSATPGASPGPLPVTMTFVWNYKLWDAWVDNHQHWISSPPKQKSCPPLDFSFLQLCCIFVVM